MSISSTDHVVVPEDLQDENVEAHTTGPETADETSTPEVTFADLGLPEGVVRKLAQNGVTVPF
ncbi:hypothetical protein, partial [Streptomyces sp. NPDC001348]